MDFMKELLSVLAVLCICVFIIWLAYICTKTIAKSGLVRKNATKNIEVLESMQLGRDKQLVICRVSGELLLLGITPQHIELISTLDREGFENTEKEESPQTAGMPFSEALKKTIVKKFGK